MKIIFFYILLFIWTEINLNAQVNVTLSAHTSASYSIPIDSVFEKFRPPIVDESTLHNLFHKHKITEAPRLYIVAYINVCKNQKVCRIKFDRLYNYSSKDFKNDEQIWQVLEDSIRNASKDWIAKPVKFKEIFKSDDNWVGSELGENPIPIEIMQPQFIIFEFADSRNQFKRFFWINSIIPYVGLDEE